MSSKRPAYNAWKSATFPPGSKDDRIDEIHAELASVDSWAFEWIAAQPDERLQHPAVDIPGAVEALRPSSPCLSRAWKIRLTGVSLKPTGSMRAWCSTPMQSIERCWARHADPAPGLCLTSG